MTDIFLSYTEKDREAAQRVASTLEAVGWSVWWDRRIPAGETWRSVLENALEDMRCMVVLWSSRSIESEWVYEEASEGRRLGKLMPVMIEAVRPPAGFREIQAADLTGWDGSREFDGMRMLIADLEALLGKPGSTTTPAHETAVDRSQAYDPEDLGGRREANDCWQRYRMAVIATTGVLLTAAGAYLALSMRQPVAPSPQASQPAPPEATRKPVAAQPAPAPPPPASSASPAATAQQEAVVAAKAPTAVEKPAPKVAQAPVKQAATPRSTSARCTDLLYKIQLGEALSDADKSLFKKACQ